MKHGYVYVGVSVAIIIIGGLLIYQLESTKQETPQNPYNIDLNQKDPFVTYMEQNSPVDLVGTVDYGGSHFPKDVTMVEGFYYSLILNENETSKLGKSKSNELTILFDYSGVRPSPDLQGKMIKIHGYLIENYAKFSQENFGGVIAGVPSGPLIVAKNIEILR